MAHRLQVLNLIHVEVFTMQPVPQPLAQHRSPHLAGVVAIERQQIVHGANALGVQPLLHARADARQVAQRQLPQSSRQNVRSQRHQPIGLLHVAGHLGEIAIRGQTDGAADHRANALQNARLHLPPQLHRCQ